MRGQILVLFIITVAAAESAINRAQKKTAMNQLNAFINEVKAQSNKHIKPECAKMLIGDAEYLISHLP